MVITYHGQQFFKLQYGDTVIALDPPSEDSDFKSSRFGADIVLTSINHPDMTGGELLSAGDKEPFIINSPGEYEVQDIFIRGFASGSNYKSKEWINTMYYFSMEDMDILFLGAFSDTEFPPEAAEMIDDVDLLFVPVGGEGVLTPAQAHKRAVTLEASIVIPMNYNDETLEKFLKEEGSEDVEPVDKFTIKLRDLSKEESKIVVLEQT